MYHYSPNEDYEFRPTTCTLMFADYIVGSMYIQKKVTNTLLLRSDFATFSVPTSKVFWINVVCCILHSTWKILGKIGNYAVKLRFIHIMMPHLLCSPDCCYYRINAPLEVFCAIPSTKSWLTSHAWKHLPHQTVLPKMPWRTQRSASTQYRMDLHIPHPQKKRRGTRDVFQTHREKCRLQIQAHTHTQSSSRSADTAEWARNTDREGSCR